SARLLALSSAGAHRDLHSFPTRRSSDLTRSMLASAVLVALAMGATPVAAQEAEAPAATEEQRPTTLSGLTVTAQKREEQLQDVRSEEHTSELQSRENLVCRLLLEKKNKK